MVITYLRVFVLFSITTLIAIPVYAVSAHNMFIITLSILSYAKWNTPTPALCVIDNPNYAVQFNQALRLHGYHYKISSIRLNELEKS